jgi:hypothetical protein
MPAVYLYVVPLPPDWCVVIWGEKDERAQIIDSYASEAIALRETERRASRHPLAVLTVPPTQLPDEVYDGSDSFVVQQPKKVWTWIETEDES